MMTYLRIGAFFLAFLVVMKNRNLKVIAVHNVTSHRTA